MDARDNATSYNNCAKHGNSEQKFKHFLLSNSNLYNEHVPYKKLKQRLIFLELLS